MFIVHGCGILINFSYTVEKVFNYLIVPFLLERLEITGL